MATDKHDTVLMYKTLVNMGLAYKQKNELNTAFRYLTAALENAHSISQLEKARLFTDVSSTLIQMRKFTDSEKYILEINRILLQTNDSVAIVENFEQLGLAYFEVEKYYKAIEYYSMALSYLPDNYNTTYQVNLYYNMGLAYQTSGRYTKASEYLGLALQLSQKMAYTKGEIAATNNIAQLLMESGNSTKAAEYFSHALELSAKNNDFRNVAWLTANMGKVYLGKKQYDKAIAYFERALKIQDSIGDLPKNKIITYLNLGEAYFLSSNWENAMLFFNLAAKGFNDTDSSATYAKILYYKGKISVKTLRFSDASQFLRQSIELAQKQQAKKLISGIYLELSELSELQSDFFQSSLFLKQYIAMNEEIFSENLENELAMLQIEYETFRKEAEIQKLTTETQLQSERMIALKQRYGALIVGIVLSVCFLIAISLLYILKNRAYQKLVNKNIEIVQHEERIKQLEINSLNVDNNANLSLEIETESLSQKFKKLLETNKLYAQKGITINDVADMLEINRTYLSQAINSDLSTNFNQLINEYRVKEAIRLLTDPNQQLSIEGIAISVGFSSKSSFNPAFKKFTGVTPSFFREQIVNKTENLQAYSSVA